MIKIVKIMEYVDLVKLRITIHEMEYIIWTKTHTKKNDV